MAAHVRLLNKWIIHLSGCPTQLDHYRLPRKHLLETLRAKFGHDLEALARFLELPLNDNDNLILHRMSDLVVDGARYPITPNDHRTFLTESNALNATISNTDFYESAVALLKNIVAHAEKLGGTVDSPVVWGASVIDKDGVVTYRIGGHLSNRIIVGYSSDQKREGKDSTLHLWRLLERSTKVNFTLKLIVEQGADEVKILELNKS